jgi:hypothetical protein
MLTYNSIYKLTSYALHPAQIKEPTTNPKCSLSEALGTYFPTFFTQTGQLGSTSIKRERETKTQNAHKGDEPRCVHTVKGSRIGTRARNMPFYLILLNILEYFEFYQRRKKGTQLSLDEQTWDLDVSRDCESFTRIFGST